MSEDELGERVDNAEESGDVGALVVLLEQVNELGNAEVAEAACDAMLRLTTPPSKAGEAALAASRAVCGAMGVFMEEAAVVEVCFGLVCNLAKESGCAKELAAHQAPKLILQGLEAFQDGEPTLQEQGCLAVEALALGCSDNIPLLKDVGIAEALERAKGLIENDRNKTYPDRALAALKL